MFKSATIVEQYENGSFVVKLSKQDCKRAQEKANEIRLFVNEHLG